MQEETAAQADFQQDRQEFRQEERESSTLADL